MKTFISILVLALIGFGIWWWGGKNMSEQVGKEKTAPIELCFAKFGDSADSEFEDKYTLRMVLERKGLEGEKVSGELRLLPAETDALVGKFEGTVSAVDKAVMSRTADLVWETEGEGMTAKQEMRIIFELMIAKLGFGEMILSEDGVYEYKDPAKVDYSLQLGAISCAELNEREAVEKYLWENIATLSPIAPVLGGNWYVVAATLDLENNSGMATYEDGHIQEKRNFTYTLNESGAVASLTIE